MTDPISNEMLAEMLAGLEGVTPGPWRMVTDYPSISIGAGDYRVVQTANQNNHQRFGTAERWIGIEHETNAGHIARCDPDTVRSLIEEVQASRRQSPEGVEPVVWLSYVAFPPDGGDARYEIASPDEDDAFPVYASPPPKAVTITDEQVLADEVLAELVRARTKFPGKNVTFAALVEEVGELATATFEESRERVRKEAVQVAVMAMRMVLDGDHTFDNWRAEKGLDPLTAALSSEAHNG